jgi:drug/metabolite transporter (DMT)-like permease
MLNSMEAKMTDHDEVENANGRPTIWMMLAALGIAMTGGAIVGYFSEMSTGGEDPLSTPGVIALAIFIAIIGGLGYSIWRNARKIEMSGEPLSRREKLNNWIVIGSGLLGGAMALILSISGTASAENPDVFSNAQISPMVALLLAFTVGVLLPLMSWYWHKKVVDEQEEAAYRTGTLFAMYSFWIVAPVWWLLWRGGMLPAPDGVVLYLMTTFVALIIWFWKKYR